MTDEPRCGLYCARANDEGICRPRCYNLTADDLTDLPNLEASVRDKLYAFQANAHGDRVTGSKQRPLGFSEDALSLIGPINDLTTPMNILAGDDLHQVGVPPLMDTLTSWVLRVRSYQRLSYWVPTTVEAACQDLLIHHDYATGYEWSFGYAGQVRTAAHEARRLCGLYDAPLEVKQGVPCRNSVCNALGLFVDQEAERVVCPVCPQRMTFTEYEDWVKLNAAYAKQKGKIA